MKAAGSSPLTRGKLLVGGLVDAGAGLIPAHAGKTLSVMSVMGVCPAHPRSRGENTANPCATHLSTGSSPLTRGKRARVGDQGSDDRLIPAHAGKTARVSLSHYACPAHPRSRGENTRYGSVPPGPTGSSPLTRGKRPPRDADPGGPGLIPAHAGKTPSVRTAQYSPPAHPRSRGENARSSRMFVRRRGSSPLTRGKPQGDRAVARRAGLIPAHAGKTLLRGHRDRRRTAHPRSRGENAKSDPHRLVEPGSSPLTRGKPRAPVGQALTARLIPAHAGKTLRT